MGKPRAGRQERTETETHRDGPAERQRPADRFPETDRARDEEIVQTEIWKADRQGWR